MFAVYRDIFMNVTINAKAAFCVPRHPGEGSRHARTRALVDQIP